MGRLNNIKAESDQAPVCEITSLGASPEVAERLLSEHQRLQSQKPFGDDKLQWPTVGTSVDINM